MDQIFILIFQLVVLLFSVMIHEISHGAMALQLGDTTAKDAGRLTLNPLKHLDFFGSLALPIVLFLLSGGSLILGWAKPVPYNPFNLKNPRRGAGLIGAAGPLSNLVIASVFAALLRLLVSLSGLPIVTSVIVLFHIIVFINILLAIFNLLPIPPLDGANILFAFLPDRYNYIKNFLIRYGFFILLLFIFFGFQIISPLIYGLYSLLVGVPLF